MVSSDRLVGGGSRHRHLQAAGAERRSADRSCPGTELRPGRQHLDGRRRRRGAHLDELLPQLLELRLLRVQLAQVGVGLAGSGELLDHRFRLEQLRLAIEVGAELRRRIGDAAAARIACVLQRRERHGELGIGERIRRRRVAGRRGDHGRREVGGVEAPVIGFAELGDGGGGLGAQPIAGDPHRRIDAPGVEGGERGAILRLGFVGAAFGGGGQLLLESDAERILRRGRWGDGRRRRRQRLGGGEALGVPPAALRRRRKTRLKAKPRANGTPTQHLRLH